MKLLNKYVRRILIIGVILLSYSCVQQASAAESKSMDINIVDLVNGAHSSGMCSTIVTQMLPENVNAGILEFWNKLTENDIVGLLDKCEITVTTHADRATYLGFSNMIGYREPRT